MSTQQRHSKQDFNDADAGASDRAGDDSPDRADESLGNREQIELSPQAAELVRQLQDERDKAIDGRLRALADFRNYQRRALDNEQRAAQSGAARMVKAILPALDHLQLALTQNPEQMSVAQLLDAVRIVRDEFNKALVSQGVEKIEPAKGEPFDPNRHEAVMRQAAEGVEPNSVVSNFQSGYALGDAILRPAKVSVAMSDDSA